jgi:hypothetical protein
MWINLKMVIFEGRHTNLGEEHWHQSGIGPDSSSSISEQGSSLLDGNMDISTVDGPSQRYDSIPTHLVRTQF